MNDMLDKKLQFADGVMELVRRTTNELLDALADGERTTLRDVVDKVVAKTGVQVSMANGLVPMFVHDWAERGYGSVNKGRSGGVFKGGKPVRVDVRPRCEACNQVVRPKPIKE